MSEKSDIIEDEQFEQKISEFYGKLLGSQESEDPEVEKFIAENFWDLLA
jgi:hypothetical protein